MPKLGLVEPSPIVSANDNASADKNPVGACVGLRSKPVQIQDAGRALNEAAEQIWAPVLKFDAARPFLYRCV
jgi:hypothetical protein